MSNEDYFIVPVTEKNRDDLIIILAKASISPRDYDYGFGKIISLAYREYEKKYAINQSDPEKYREIDAFIDEKIYLSIMRVGTKKSAFNFVIAEYLKNHTKEEIAELIKK